METKLNSYFFEDEWDDNFLDSDFHDEVSIYNHYFSNIGIPDFEMRPLDFYIGMGIDLDKFRHVFFRSQYEKHITYLLYVGWEFKQIEQNKNHDELDPVKVETINNAKILRFLRKTAIEKVNVSIYGNTKETHYTQNKLLINLLKSNLEEQFKTHNNSDPSLSFSTFASSITLLA